MSSALRILHIITGLECGGAERQLALLLRNNDPDRYRHEVISLTDEGHYGEDIRASGTTLFTLGIPRSEIRPSALFDLARLIRDERPDLVQTWLYDADFAGMLACPLAGSPPLIWNLRCSDLPNVLSRRVKRWCIKLMARMSHRPVCVIANSEAGLRAHHAIGYHPRRSVIIPNGVEADAFVPDAEAHAAVRQEIGVGRDEFLIGCVARYDPMKDHRNLLQAFAPFARDARLLLIGRDMHRGNARLLGDIARSGIDGTRIMLLGERRDMPRVMAALDMTVLASAFGEGFPNAVAEAMCCAVPVVATDTGDTAAIVGECGTIVSPRDPASLSAGIAAILDMTPPERKALGLRARARITERFPVTAMVDRYADLYDELAGTGLH